MSIQRFCPSLTTGYWPDNPEPLVRDDLGDYVKFEDYKSELEAAISRAEKEKEFSCRLADVLGACEAERNSFKAQLSEDNKEIAELKEQLRWRKWPDEKPHLDGVYWIQKPHGLYSCFYSARHGNWADPGEDDIEAWLPIPELVESPQRDDLGQPLIQKGNLQTLTAKIIELQKELEQPMTEGIAYLGGYLIDNHEELFPNGEDQIRLICHKAATQLVESPPTGEEK